MIILRPSIGRRSVDPNEPVATVIATRTIDANEPIATRIATRTIDANEPVATVIATRTIDANEPVATVIATRIINELVLIVRHAAREGTTLRETSKRTSESVSGGKGEVWWEPEPESALIVVGGTPTDAPGGETNSYEDRDDDDGYFDCP